jgi:nitrogen fixation protein NifU and related proteins
MDEGLYQEHILDHSKRPRYKRELVNPTFTSHESNPLCGDELTIFAKLENNIIKEITFTGEGCAISQAAASMLVEYLQGKTLQDVEQLNELKMQELLGIIVSPLRIKCALLAFNAIKNGVRKQEVEQ